MAKNSHGSRHKTVPETPSTTTSYSGNEISLVPLPEIDYYANQTTSQIAGFENNGNE